MTVPLPENDRELVFLIEQTIVKRYYYTPSFLKTHFEDAWRECEARGGTFDDFVIDLFQEYDGSVFHGRFFYDDANPSVGYELIERWDDD